MADAFLDQTLDINFQGDITIAGTLAVTGAQTFTGALAVTGAITSAATITAATGLVATTGGVTATAGGVTVTAGGLTITAGGLTHTAGNVGFFGATPVAQQSALTSGHATFTQAGTDSGDVAIQAITNSSPYGFVNAAEGECIVAVALNNLTRIAEIETILSNYGLTA